MTFCDSDSDTKMALTTTPIPQHSLEPCEFFLLRFIKDHVYIALPLNDVQDLRHRIEEDLPSQVLLPKYGKNWTTIGCVPECALIEYSSQ